MHALSQNELVILDRQMTVVARQLSEIASALESRLGQANDTALTARIIEEGFADLARKIHNQAHQTGPDPDVSMRSQSA
jgi:hypothetical protein